jgi:hypothetical protein
LGRGEKRLEQGLNNNPPDIGMCKDGAYFGGCEAVVDGDGHRTHPKCSVKQLEKL